MVNTFALAGPNSKYKIAGSPPAGFLAGLWHGIIAPLTFIISLFDQRIRIYEINNNGRWYDLGFILGISASFGGSGASH